MIVAFEPIMEEGNIETTVDYYYEVFVPLGEVAPAMSQENIDNVQWLHRRVRCPRGKPSP